MKDTQTTEASCFQIETQIYSGKMSKNEYNQHNERYFKSNMWRHGIALIQISYSCSIRAIFFQTLVSKLLAPLALLWNYLQY